MRSIIPWTRRAKPSSAPGMIYVSWGSSHVTGLRSSDSSQSPLVGTRVDEMLKSRSLDSTSDLEEAGVSVLEPFVLT